MAESKAARLNRVRTMAEGMGYALGEEPPQGRIAGREDARYFVALANGNLVVAGQGETGRGVMTVGEVEAWLRSRATSQVPEVEARAERFARQLVEYFPEILEHRPFEKVVRACEGLLAGGA